VAAKDTTGAGAQGVWVGKWARARARARNIEAETTDSACVSISV